VLGVRLAMLGCRRLGIEQPRGKDRKRLVTFVEIDRCATDAIGVVTGCRLGKRALKFRDWGKMAATFVDLESHRAIRIVARETSKDLARQLHPEIENKNLQQMAAYREMSDQDLFDEQWVQVQGSARRLRAMRRRNQLRPVCGTGWTYPLPLLCRSGRALLPAA
jgi:formylmethanofuran dehydrogenase subunit E